MSRLYETTHPWIKFQLDLTSAHYEFWMLLGECRSKIEHIAGVPLKPELSEKMHEVYLAKGVHATTAIEGNTLSEAQVQQALEGVLRTPPSQEYLEREVRNIIRACNKMGRFLFSEEDALLTLNRIRYFNVEVRYKLPPKPDCTCRAGKISEHPVVVGNVYKGAPREDCAYLLSRLCDWLNGPSFEIKKLDPIVVGILKSIVAHLYIAWIHPFCDGNGRTARLAEFMILLGAGVPSPAAHLLSNHYNATRIEYYSQLARTSLSGGDIMPFLHYAVQGLRDQLIEQLNWIREQQIETAWLRFVGEAFPSPPQNKHKRQRLLVESLGSEPIPINKLRSVSPTVAHDYARVSESTLARDISELVKLGLIVIDEVSGSVRAKREQILAFMPGRTGAKENATSQTEPPKRRRGRPRLLHHSER